MATILYIEDDPDARRALQVLLEKRGHGVVTASSAEESLEILLSWTPELVVTDLLLPGIDGAELCRLLRHRPETEGLPIILVTGVAPRVGLSFTPSDKQWAPADEIMDKKTDPTELVDLVERLLKRGPSTPETPA